MECECIRCWINERVTYTLLHISTIYHAIHSIMELKKTSLFCWNTKIHATFYTSRSRFTCFPYSIYPYRSSTIWIWKFARTVTTTVTSTVFIKLTARLVILMFSRCCWWLSWFRDARMFVISCWKFVCEQKCVLEEMLNFFHNILMKNELIYYVHLGMCMMALNFKHEVIYCEYVN